MTETRWQVQEAKQKFSEVLRHAEKGEPQIVTRHGEDVAVIIDIEEYRHTHKQKPSFEEFLLRPGGPYLDDLDLERDKSLFREIDFGDED